MMGEAGQMHPVLLAFELLCMFSLLAIVDLESIICSSDYSQLSRIIKVQRRHVRLVVVRSESLRRRVSILGHYNIGRRLTLQGLNVVITSLTFWFGGPPLGASTAMV